MLLKLKAMIVLFVVARVCLAGGLIGQLRADDQPRPQDKLSALEGKWKKVKFLHLDLESIAEPGEDDVIVEIKGKTIDFNKSAQAVITDHDPATDPRCLDFKVVEGDSIFRKGSTYESVYKLDGDILTMSVYWGKGKNRPNSLEKPTQPRVIVMVFERVKE